METKLSYDCLSPHLLHIRIAGCFRIDRNSPKLHKILHLWFIGLTFGSMIVFTVQQAVKLFQVGFRHYRKS